MKPIEKEFFSFIYSRQLIYHKRFVLHLPAPWTDDQILSKFKIINMYRELDACTIYIMDKIKEENNRQKLLLNIVFFRFFNKRNLYENLNIKILDKIDENDRQKLIDSFSRMQQKGKPIFNDAYLISSGEKGEKKHESIIDYLKTIDWQVLIIKIDSASKPEESLDVLQSIPMVGPFLACEIWTDLSYIKFFKQGWTDNDFVNIGPGAEWGLEILANKKLNKKEQYVHLNHLHKLQESILPTINKDLDEHLPWTDISYKKASSNVPFLSLTNIEGALCEFRKYHRLKQGLGKRRYFSPQN